MFNVTVLKMKDIIKYLVGIIITISLVIYATRYFSSIKNKIKEDNKKQSKIEIFQIGSLTSCLDKTIPTMSNVNEENNNKENKNYLEQFLKTEISSMNGIEKLEETSKAEDTKTENIDNEDKQETTEQVTVVSNTENVKTEVVTQNPITESYNAEYGKVKIKNQTKYSLTEEILKPDIKIDNKNILIFHTHSCESYTPSEKYQYTQTGNYRTTDLNYTVTRVGTELENYLKQYNINVQHNTSYHDYPSYTGSYTRSLNTVENMLKTIASDIIIDLHRDAIGSRPDYAPTVKIGEEYAAQIMFVIRNKRGWVMAS